MAENVPLFTANCFKSAIEFVKAELGDRGLRRALADAGLPSNLPTAERFFVPEVSAGMFMDSAARQTGEPLLSAKLGGHIYVENEGTWGRYVVEGETLGASLKRFERAVICFCSYRGLSVALVDDLAWFRFRFATSGHDNYVHLAFAATGSFINIIRHFTWPNWFPETIQLNIPPPSSPSVLEDILPADIRYNAPFIGVSIPREFLTLRRRPELPLGHTTYSDALRARNHRPSENFEAVMEEIIRIQIECGSVSLDAAARSLDLGIRTVQRKLERTGLHFRDLTSRMRMNIARERVTETNLPLATIAHSVGYTNQFNFSRAFHQHFGRPPSEIRKLALAMRRRSTRFRRVPSVRPPSTLRG